MNIFNNNIEFINEVMFYIELYMLDIILFIEECNKQTLWC